ncbi:Transcriptional regulator NRG1 like protein [Verticillium longisporum]|uniref:C2H2 type master regulator of conidiophore development brlA n=2 Tax=Verticillium TaxID=1036719 RepID=A0A2J8CJX3_VERDA|nr:hypothetical protein VdG2_02992 [Verticillium dahliae VDG2]KAF3355568.1 hypothetical protein VdG1_06980 [Verticillium dahliae VDG1]KAG7110977.1 Transcriptional regulator NRG1 like protein [Verticillium longisporum]PNH34498.1 hypothetical protein BJF96_g2321 [Verticillium dahliae]PNH37310.1 hypothetical protein VD0004_g9477 [Verticillium dahliae]
MMQARDATGRKVSLLNDDAAPSPSFISPAPHAQPQRPSYRASTLINSQNYSTSSLRSNSPSPHTPELLRSGSYDSNMSTGPGSPLTPTAYEYSRAHPFVSGQPLYDEYDQTAKRPTYAATSRSNSYDDDATATSNLPDRAGKRYPCRYRDSHGCEKTFTTSGHASRHSKIHTAEKAVQCTFAGCQKKFTRADNMKQHLETHYKDKARMPASTKPVPSRAAVGALTGSARRSSSSSKTSASFRAAQREQAAWDAEQYNHSASNTTPLPSPGVSSGAWDLRALNAPLMSRPNAARTPSGLDALAMAIACQEG